MNDFRKLKVDDLEIEYELADYTEPWRTDTPETVLLHHGYCRNMRHRHARQASPMRSSMH